MDEIILKTVRRKTTVTRAAVRKAVAEVFGTKKTAVTGKSKITVKKSTAKKG